MEHLPGSRRTEVLIAGGGLAGIVTACELLGSGKQVLLVEKGTADAIGGLARESYGGIHLIGTPHQRKAGIRDTPELAFRDWERHAGFGPEDDLGRQWAKLYCDASLELIHDFLRKKGVSFLPEINWLERGLFRPGNSVPRWHVTRGTGRELIHRLLRAIDAHPKRSNLEILCEQEVSGWVTEGERIVGVRLKRMSDGAPTEARAEHIVVASGGIGGGDLSKLRANWYAPWGAPPKVLLNGAHRYGDGMLHDQVAAVGGQLHRLDRHWLYVTGVHHPAKRRPNDGLCLVAPRSALWMNALGERIGPVPLVANHDTRFMVEQILKQPGQYSWLVLNWKIALKELGVSAADYLGSSPAGLVRRLIKECPDDVVVARTLDELVGKMNERSLEGYRVDGAAMADAIEEYDAQIQRGPRFFVDDQLRRLMNFRTNPGDRSRICAYQRILDPRARPLIALRQFILSRKSLGGIRTDLRSRVLRADGAPIPGLYAVGEAAGFGGGGIHGLRSLEGTFLGSCVLTGRIAARTIAGG